MTSTERIAELLKSVASEDEINDLLETAKVEIRKDMKEDLIIDLKEWDETSAAKIIEENY